MHKNKGTDQMRGNRAADLQLLFSHIEKKIMFSHDTSQMLAVVHAFLYQTFLMGAYFNAGFYGEILKIVINYMVSSYILQ